MMESALTSQFERHAKLSGPPTNSTISGERFNKLCVNLPKDLKRHKTKSALICYELLVNISALSSRSPRGGVDFLHLFVCVCYGCVLEAKDV